MKFKGSYFKPVLLKMDLTLGDYLYKLKHVYIFSWSIFWYVTKLHLANPVLKFEYHFLLEMENCSVFFQVKRPVSSFYDTEIGRFWKRGTKTAL